jgi:hypothetical protein
MPKHSKAELLTVLRFVRRLLSAWIEKADKDTLRLINGELGQMKRQVAGRLKE